ncbi:MAG: molybdopterin-synthase adenylyltransferase MoeB [Gemmatimonadaceae bacterium]|nr:molybdopterin-synthase adenylyltransferase MoeB [Gemmatimonadaceae bacterium]
MPRPAGVTDAATSMLSPEEIARYSRHLILPEVGMAGQQRLKEARVLLVGTGGLGSPLALYLAAAGVGTLGLVDFDVVDASNLQRQVIHGTKDIGRPKLDSAADRLHDVNPFVRTELHHTRLDRGNALDIVREYDIVVDGTDNFPTRYLVNDACVLTGRTNVYGSIFRFEGQLSVFGAPGGPCYRCLFREPPPPGLVPSCAEGGVLGVLPGIIGTMQATETIKQLLGIGDSLSGRMLLFDALGMSWRTLRVKKDPDCPVCGTAPTQRELIDYVQFCGMTPPAGADAAMRSMRPRELVARFGAGETLTLLDVREPGEWEIVNLAEHGARLIPLATLGEHCGDLDREALTVVHCKAGGRSARAVRQLEEAGFTQVWNLDGGILAWSDEVDPAKPKY